MRKSSILALCLLASAALIGFGGMSAVVYAQTTTMTPAEEINGVIIAVASLLSAIGGILGFLASKFHLGAQVQKVASSLKETDQWVAENEAKLAVGIHGAVGISPEAQKWIQDHIDAIEALRQRVVLTAGQVKEVESATGTTATATSITTTAPLNTTAPTS